MRILAHVVFCFSMILSACNQSGENQFPNPEVRSVAIAAGWAATPVNVTIHRKHSLVSYDGYQFVAFYDADARVVLGKRLLGDDEWEFATTQYSGNAQDEHNTINLMVDGDGFLHLAWDHHVDSLHYAISIAPGVLKLSEQQTLIGKHEGRVTYPEFYPVPSGDILMAYRHGTSGDGVMVLNLYDHRSRQWSRLQDVLIDGEGQRNPYWQLHVDNEDTIHLSWVWRESPDVVTNHDMMYAKSVDGGRIWQRSNGDPYSLPITAASAEVVWAIPQGSNLINQTSMTADAQGKPWIATYWRGKSTGVTQVRTIWFDGSQWLSDIVSDRVTDFSLGGLGTQITPLSRPLILAGTVTGEARFIMVYRDAESGNRVVLSMLTPGQEPLSVELGSLSVGSWEPTYDPVLWRERQELHLLLQVIDPLPKNSANITPSMLSVLEVSPF